jgi:hypothetical protein
MVSGSRMILTTDDLDTQIPRLGGPALEVPT